MYGGKLSILLFSALFPNPQYCSDFCNGYKYYGAEFGEGEFAVLLGKERHVNCGQHLS